jgi:hypothetical protein
VDVKAEAENEGWVQKTSFILCSPPRLSECARKAERGCAQQYTSHLRERQVEGVVKQLQRKVAEGEHYSRMCKTKGGTSQISMMCACNPQDAPDVPGLQGYGSGLHP